MDRGIRFLDPDSGDEMELGKWYDTSVREQYHFNPFMNWVNDPNGLCWFKGYYHLFYQSNPFGQEWNDMYWGHAVSRDLIHWTHMPMFWNRSRICGGIKNTKEEPFREAPRWRENRCICI